MNEPLTYVIIWFVCMIGGFVIGYAARRICKPRLKHQDMDPQYFHNKWDADPLYKWDEK